MTLMIKTPSQTFCDRVEGTKFRDSLPPSIFQRRRSARRANARQWNLDPRETGQSHSRVTSTPVRPVQVHFKNRPSTSTMRSVMPMKCVAKPWHVGSEGCLPHCHRTFFYPGATEPKHLCLETQLVIRLVCGRHRRVWIPGVHGHGLSC